MKVDKKQAKLNAWDIVYLHVYCPCHFQGVFRIYKTLSYSNYESVVWPTAILSLESIDPYQPDFFVLHILCLKYMFFFNIILLSNSLWNVIVITIFCIVLKESMF